MLIEQLKPDDRDLGTGLLLFRGGRCGIIADNILPPQVCSLAEGENPELDL